MNSSQPWNLNFPLDPRLMQTPYWNGAQGPVPEPESIVELAYRRQGVVENNRLRHFMDIYDLNQPSGENLSRLWPDCELVEPKHTRNGIEYNCLRVPQFIWNSHGGSQGIREVETEEGHGIWIHGPQANPSNITAHSYGRPLIRKDGSPVWLRGRAFVHRK